MSQEEPGFNTAHVELGLSKMTQQVKGFASKPNDPLISRTHVIELAPASCTHNT